MKALRYTLLPLSKIWKQSSDRIIVRCCTASSVFQGGFTIKGPNNIAFDAYLFISDDREFEKSLKRHLPLRVDTNGYIEVFDTGYWNK
jgi:hypothetical protein